MLSYTWYLSEEQPVQPNTLSAIQCILASLSVFLDMKIEGGKVSLTVFVPEQLSPSSSGKPPKCLDDLGAAGGFSTAPAPHGRPIKLPNNDITLEQAYKMQSEGMKADDIAAFIGVSRRTFYRKLHAAKQSGVDPTAPYSKWDQEASR